MRDHVWFAIGLAAQLLFFGRFIVQWLVSERRGRSTVPAAFWYFSLAGGVLLLGYSIHRRDPIFILGQSLGLLVYVRNLMLIARRRPMTTRRLAPWAALAGFALLMSLAFIGTRGLWEPDEGRYAESAREMLVSGDFMTPRLGAQPHFSKPPLTYWLIAGSMAAFGPNEIAVRLPTALCFAATVLVVALLGSSLWGRRTGLLAGVVYATFVTTFAAANIVTPDTPLALWEALALYAFWRGFSTTSTAGRWIWPAVTGAALGLAMMTKGPPGLLFLPAMLLFRALPAGRRPQAAPVLSFAGVVLFCAVGLSWYVASVLRNPGLLSYFIGEEFVGRIAGQHHRNHEWYGALAIYLPTLTLGALPWCLAWPAIFRRWRDGTAGEPLHVALAHRPRPLLLALAVLVPLAVFSLSRSRLPLYLLPLFVPIALATARGLLSGWTAATERPVRFLGVSAGPARALAAWAVVLLAARFAFAAWPSPKDARELYHSLPRARGAELVMTDTRPHYGLVFYYARERGDFIAYSWIHGTPPESGPAGVPIAQEMAEESGSTGEPHVYIVADSDWQRLDAMLRSAGATILRRDRLRGVVAVLTAQRMAGVGSAVR